MTLAAGSACTLLSFPLAIFYVWATILVGLIGVLY